MSYIDRILVCRDCFGSFTFGSGEQAFYSSRGLLNDPQRCPPCRSARRHATLVTHGPSYVSYGRFASFGGRNPRQMHPATCSTCGEMTEVPFVPKPERPVLCNECFFTARRQPPDDYTFPASA
jgi:CxxC-x17-CxxC domain-containing protein